MKRLGIVMLLSIMFTFGGCDEDISTKIINNISEYCEEYFVGETQDYYIELFDGEREEPYYLDGVSETKERYCLIVVTPKEGEDLREDMEYCVEVNGDTLEGGLEVSPFDDTLSSDMQLALSNTDNIFVYIKLNTSTQVSKMTCISADFALDWRGVLDSTYEKLSMDINTLMQSHNSMECYIQVINKDISMGKYYWCVTLIFDDGDKYAIIVDTQSGEILAKNL